MNSIELSRRSRIESLKMVYNANASHIASALSMIDIISVLYNSIMKTYPSDQDNPKRDRFILSKGHACVGLYAVLAEIGFFSKKKLSNYGKNESILMNHISHKVPGVEFSTGSLGHGLPFGVGKALAAKLSGNKWKTYVLLSDGELQEGSNWESFMFASHNNLDNLIAIIDYNNLQSLTTVDETLSLNPLDKKLSSFGWNVEIVNGHDHKAIELSFKNISLVKDKPSVIIAQTIKGKGVNFMENKVEWHYKTPSKNELSIALDEIENA